MGLKDDLEKYVADTHRSRWRRRDGDEVPKNTDLGLGNDAVELDGVVLYADLAESTGLVKGHKDWFAAEVYKNYLYCAAKILRAKGGAITAYDGDRIMAVFLGNSKNSNAATCGRQINYAVGEILQPAIEHEYPKTTFKLKQKVGVDASKLFVARTGIRGNNDLVWVGNAANNAAKLAALSTKYSTYISAAVYGRLNEESKIDSKTKRNMWTDLGSDDLGYQIYGSTWRNSSF